MASALLLWPFCHRSPHWTSYTGLRRDVGCRTHSTYTILEFLCRVSWGWVGLCQFYYSQSCHSLVCYTFPFYRVEMMPSVRPSGLDKSDLSWGAFTFGLGRGGKIRCGMAIVPCLCLSVFILKCLNFLMQGGKRDYGPTPWWKHCGLSHMVFPIHIDALDHPNH